MSATDKEDILDLLAIAAEDAALKATDSLANSLKAALLAANTETFTVSVAVSLLEETYASARCSVINKRERSISTKNTRTLNNWRELWQRTALKS